MQIEEFYNSVMDCSKALILSSKQLVALVSDESAEGLNEEKIQDCVSEVENKLEEVIRLVTTKVSEISSSVPRTQKNRTNFEFALDATKSVRASMQSLLHAAIAVMSNPFDFLTKQRMRNETKAVADSLKNVIASVDALKGIDMTGPDESAAIPLSGSLSLNADEGNVTTDAKNAIMALAKLRQCTAGYDESEFITAVKDVSKAVTELLVTARTMRLKEIADRLKEATVGLISTAKMLSNNPGDELYVGQLEMATAKVAEAIKSVVYGVRDSKRRYSLITQLPLSRNSSTDVPVSPASPNDNTDRNKNEAINISQDEARAEREKIIKIFNEKKREMEEHEKKRVEEDAKDKKKDPKSKEKEEKEKLKSKEKEEKAKKKEEKAKEKKDKKDKKEPVKSISEPVPASPRTSSIGDKVIEILADSMTKTFRKEWDALPEDAKTSVRNRILAEVQKSQPTRTVSLTSISRSGSSHADSIYFPGAEPELTVEQTKEMRVAAMRSQMQMRMSFDRRASNAGENESTLVLRSMEAARTTGEAVVEFILRASSSITESAVDLKTLADSVQVLINDLKNALDIGSASGRLQKLALHERVLASALKAVENTPMRGSPISNIVNAAAGISQTARLVEGTLQQKIFNDADAVRALASQLIVVLTGIASHLGHTRILSSLYQLGAVIQSFVDAKERLMDGVETLRYIASMKPNQPLHSSHNEPDLTVIDFDEDDVNIWDETPLNATPKGFNQNSTNTDENIQAGTLNKLVEVLTNEEVLDNRFLKTFITTYQSFTTPSKLLDKLIQRYDAPIHRVPKKTIHQIQIRVAVVLKYWIENQYEDFDESLTAKVLDFYSRLASDGHVDLARLLKREFEKKGAERSAKIRALLSAPPTDVTIVDVGKLSPLNYFLALNDSEIARQLTLIDFKLYESIEFTELLNQSWSKESLKHRSPNVLSMISRANRVSFWVSSMILFHDNVTERSKMIQKFISIAEELRKHNNYHTLMGLIAGLNTSSITRLKKTFDDVPLSARESFKNLEKLMNPASSYKSYRGALHKSSLPSLPYIGTYLSDLTFIEDGNPDMTKNQLINFGKRELVYNVIEEVSRYQQSSYIFPVVEPINTLLTDLPACSENDLYDLSLKYEPRENKTISQAATRTMTGKKSSILNIRLHLSGDQGN